VKAMFKSKELILRKVFNAYFLENRKGKYLTIMSRSFEKDSGIKLRHSEKRKVKIIVH